MASALIQQRDEFQAAFNKECNIYIKKLEKTRPGEKQDPERLDVLRSLATDMLDTVTRRLISYEHGFELDKVAEVAGPSRSSGQSASAPMRNHLQDLQAQLEQRTAEEAQLREEWLQRQNEANGEALRQSNVDVLRARQGALAVDQVLAEEASAAKGQQLQQQLHQIETILSATTKLTSSVEKDRENNRLIEEQRRRPHHMESELMLVPVDHGTVDAEMEDEEAQRLAAEVERSGKVSRRMMRQFADSA